MTRPVKLRDIASARAGDKGNTINIAVWPYDPRNFAAIKKSLTAQRVKQAFPGLFKGDVRRFELDRIGGLNFVIDDALEGGVNRSLNLDAHGKSFSYLLLEMEIELDDEMSAGGDEPA